MRAVFAVQSKKFGGEGGTTDNDDYDDDVNDGDDEEISFSSAHEIPTGFQKF